jgi:hypothetical protein
MWMYGPRKIAATPASTSSTTFKGRGQFWVEPCGVVRVTGRELELDEVSTGVQFRAHPHQRGRVPGRVYLGNDGDEAVLGVGYEPAKVFGAIERDVGLRVLGRPHHWETPALIVGQVQVQHVKLVEREKVDHALKVPCL